MGDADLSVGELTRILQALGCSVEFTKTGYFKASRRLPDGQTVFWMQHCHKGPRDTFRKHVVRVARRSLRLLEKDGTTDKSFYSNR